MGRFFAIDRPRDSGRASGAGSFHRLVSPGIIGWDFSALKNFNLFSEGRYVQYRFEAFNFPNHPNWNNPNTNVANAAFGQITSTRGNMRNLQIALKFVF